VTVAVFLTVATTPEAVTVVLVPTGSEVRVAVTLVLPDGTVTVEAANFAAVAGDALMVTMAPAGPAGEFRLKVTVEFVTPPRTVVGLAAMVVKAAGSTVKIAVFPTPKVAVRVTEVDALTGSAVTLNVPLLAPAAIATDVVDRVVAAEFEVVSATLTPPAGALPRSVIVPVAD
jgi:hypothetical protein